MFFVELVLIQFLQVYAIVNMCTALALALNYIRFSEMNKAIYITILVSLILSGCATTENYRKELNTWMGATPDNLVSSDKWGIPDSRYALTNGNKVYCYERQSVYQTPYYTAPGTAYSRVVNNRIYTTTYPGNVMGGEIHHFACTTCFFFNKQNEVYHYTIRGNNCIS